MEINRAKPHIASEPTPSERMLPKHNDLNTASQEELEVMCQIDGQRAECFVEKRRELGGYTSWEQIKENVSSFDGGTIKRLKKAGFSLS